jgi:hypothetical protein
VSRQQTPHVCLMVRKNENPLIYLRTLLVTQEYVDLRGIIKLYDGVYGESRNCVLEALKAFLCKSLGDLVCDSL